MLEHPPQTIEQLFRLARQYTDCTQEIIWLLQAATGISHARLLAQKDFLVSESVFQLFTEYVKRRYEQHEPLQYIIGSVLFCDLTLVVRPPVLIPRPETEEMAWMLIEYCTRHRNEVQHVLDLCTGSGCLAIALAYHCPWLKIVAVDIDPAAIMLARENIERLVMDNVRIVESDLYSGLKDEEFDVIVTNPPYLSVKEYDLLDYDVRRWESRRALVAHDDGMEMYARIFDGLNNHYRKPRVGQSKQLVFMAELGLQPDRVLHEFKQRTSFQAELVGDMNGKQRFLAGYRSMTD